MPDVTLHHSPPRLPEAPRSWRTTVLTGIVLAHLTGLALIVMGYWITGLVIIVASHLIFSGVLPYPGHACLARYSNTWKRRAVRSG